MFYSFPLYLQMYASHLSFTFSCLPSGIFIDTHIDMSVIKHPLDKHAVQINNLCEGHFHSMNTKALFIMYYKWLHNLSLFMQAKKVILHLTLQRNFLGSESLHKKFDFEIQFYLNQFHAFGYSRI